MPPNWPMPHRHCDMVPQQDGMPLLEAAGHHQTGVCIFHLHILKLLSKCPPSQPCIGNPRRGASAWAFDAEAAPTALPGASAVPAQLHPNRAHTLAHAQSRQGGFTRTGRGRMTWTVAGAQGPLSVPRPLVLLTCWCVTHPKWHGTIHIFAACTIHCVCFRV